MAIYSNSIALLWKCKLLWKAQLKPYFKSTCHRSTDILEVVAKQISLIGIKRRHEDINENLQKLMQPSEVNCQWTLIQVKKNYSRMCKTPLSVTPSPFTNKPFCPCFEMSSSVWK